MKGKILNLVYWLPQKDVWGLIYKKLTKLDWKVVWAAHSRQKEKEIYTDSNFCKKCAKEGHLGLLQWARSNVCPWDKYTCSGAAEGGHLESLKWARENGHA